MKPEHYKCWDSCSSCGYDSARSKERKFCVSCDYYSKPHLHLNCSACGYSWLEYTKKKSDQLILAKNKRIQRAKNALQVAGLSRTDIKMIDCVVSEIGDHRTSIRTVAEVKPTFRELIKQSSQTINFKLKSVWNRIEERFI